MQEQHTREVSNDERALPEFDRRRGPRRASANGEVETSFERRQTDRRKKKPGLAGLIGAILGHAPPDSEL